MIFAAGLGTRLGPLTATMPKALVRVEGVPMLERVISRLEAAGIREFVVNVHHFAPMIKAFLEENGNFGARIDISEETDSLLETGGGLRRAAALLDGGRFLVHNVDMFTDLDLRSFIGQDNAASLATLLVTEAEADRYLLFDDDMRLAGWTDTRTGEVRSPYPDFEPSLCRRLSFCGIHMVSPAIFPLMEDWPEKFSITDFYLDMAASHLIRGVCRNDMRMVDIGSPEKLALADSLAATF